MPNWSKSIHGNTNLSPVTEEDHDVMMCCAFVAKDSCLKYTFLKLGHKLADCRYY